MEEDTTVKLFKKDYIIKELKKYFDEKKLIFVSTEKYDLTTNPSGRNSKKDRSAWADETVRKIFNEDRNGIVKSSRNHSCGEYNFSYIKFAENKRGDIYGIVHGKSSFHRLYPSDVWFYDVDNSCKTQLVECFDKYNLEWYTKEILIVKNQNKMDGKEAYINEKKLKVLFNTFD